LATASGTAVLDADFVAYAIFRDGTTLVGGNIPEAWLIALGTSQWGWSISGLDEAVPAGAHTYGLYFFASDFAADNDITEGFFQVTEINE
jgi:hypothetical protein